MKDNVLVEAKDLDVRKANEAYELIDYCFSLQAIFLSKNISDLRNYDICDAEALFFVDNRSGR